MKSLSNRPRIYRVTHGYDVISSDNTLYHVQGLTFKKIGKIGANFKPSGNAVKGIPNEIKSIFFKIQAHE
jgi:hypothetical protein